VSRMASEFSSSRPSSGPQEKHLRCARLRSVRRSPLQTGIRQKRRVFSGAGLPCAGQLYLSLRFVACRSSHSASTCGMTTRRCPQSVRAFGAVPRHKA
jgi:hypothetical protein